MSEGALTVDVSDLKGWIETTIKAETGPIIEKIASMFSKLDEHIQTSREENKHLRNSINDLYDKDRDMRDRVSTGFNALRRDFESGDKELSNKLHDLAEEQTKEQTKDDTAVRVKRRILNGIVLIITAITAIAGTILMIGGNK